MHGHASTIHIHTEGSFRERSITLPRGLSAGELSLSAGLQIMKDSCHVATSINVVANDKKPYKPAFDIEYLLSGVINAEAKYWQRRCESELGDHLENRSKGKLGAKEIIIRINHNYTIPSIMVNKPF